MTSDPNTDPLADLMGGPDLGDLMGPADLGADDFDPDDLMAEEPDPTPDPLAGVPQTDDLAADAAAELTALEEGYRARAKAEANRFRQATDSEFWVALVFADREEKEAFLEQFNLTDLGDKYLVGRKVARRLEARS